MSAAILSIAFLVSVSAVACGKREAEPWLAALRKERLATLVPPGGKLVLANETEAHTALSKPVTAHILRAFAYADADGAARGRDAVINAARSSGWRVSARPAHPGDPLFGAKRLSVGDATLTVGKYRSSHGFRVSVQLEQGTCPRQLCGG